MTRRCSHCYHNGHNSRTCPNRGGVKLFGVRLTDGSIRKSASVGNLSHLATSSASPPDGPDPGAAASAAAEGYASEDFVQGSSSSCRDRKKGVPWTKDEHKMFLLGLQKLGKGDWRGIARNYVVSRTPTQVASHAQKYFVRQTNLTRRKRRSSLFDMVPDEPVEPQPTPMNCQESEMQCSKPLPEPLAMDEESKSNHSNNPVVGEAADPKPETLQCSYPVIPPAYFSPFFQFYIPCWPGYQTDALQRQGHEIVKPTAMHSRTPIDIDELVGMSKLSIEEPMGKRAPLSPSLNLLGGSTRQSAFHANPPTRTQA
ncbi:transcription factor MYBS3 [Cocos nucifera]|uniref:Transcription factor MYBS3 n=1 Tax=Cocos nucifera TaxID=13894 RepID=A0A8K0IN44_COCNU|nr:transcription factor MYBS3 [Cocos nucifera]